MKASLVLGFVASLFASTALSSPVGTLPLSFSTLSTATTPSTCPTTVTVFPHFTEGPTSTFFPSTITSTSSVDCGAGCDELVTTTRFLGVGPVVHFTTTVVAEEPSTATAFVCMSTGGAYPY